MTSLTRKNGDYEQFYREALENAAHFNTRLVAERRMRLPFLDSQTGVAQNNCFIWMQKRHRGPGLEEGQLYTYPSRRWRKKRKPQHAPLVDSSNLYAQLQQGESSNDGIDTIQEISGFTETDSNHPETSTNLVDKDQEELFREMEAVDDIPDAGEIERADSESDEDFEVSSRKRRGRGKGRGGGRKKAPAIDADMPILQAEEKEKPFGCKVCGKRYKNRPGLNYHMSHYHQEIEAVSDEQSQPSPLQLTDPHFGSSMALGESQVVRHLGMGSCDWRAKATQNKTKKKMIKGIAEPNNYCDFCLGDTYRNKEGTQEQLVSCADCGRSGHPSCLQFTENITAKVKSYRWQCIECKSCGLCGTSDNDDQLLFCDDCDRGYHMYCLKPPMSAPPEGSWICNLCKSPQVSLPLPMPLPAHLPQQHLPMMT
ncbi:zinc finger protein DPF3-like isoform X1 [Asterias rubens]|uniref:zinc finger protein DPF3-like isoform X1 n=1 Tax=Asterias rubens TaxID=7604 RepID=UPI0014556FE1|nr:zinc finger protein DPF3-like isoform X1 [Asterias rubens]